MHLKTAAVIVIILIGVLPLSSQNALPVSSKSTSASGFSAPVAHPLLISSGDLLDLNVFDTPELSAKLRVDEHGAVTLPLAGAVSVGGLTAEQAAHVIEDFLRAGNILNEPHVSVTILEYSTQGVTVVGEVKNPGVYPLLGSHGVIDLISAAGGATTAAGKAVTITHRDDPKHPEIVTVESRPGTSAALNVDVRPGDTIMVAHAGIVYVLGEVIKPGGFLIENNDRLTVLQAVALAQGTTKTAAPNQAKLIRKTASGRQEVRAPLKKIVSDKAPDLLLADGDILFIPGSATKSALRDIESILPSVSSAAIYHVP
jgi:polysaccharide biosynthesis/export protein